MGDKFVARVEFSGEENDSAEIVYEDTDKGFRTAVKLLDELRQRGIRSVDLYARGTPDLVEL